MVASNQTHTTNVRLVTEEDAGKGVVRKRDYTDVDGADHQCRRYYAGNVLCRLRTAVFSGSENIKQSVFPIPAGGGQ